MQMARLGIGATVAIAGALLLLANVASAAGRGEDFDSARRAYNTAWEDYRDGRGAEARVTLERLISDYPAYRDPYVLLAILFHEGGRPLEATRVYRDLLKERPADVDVRLWRAGILLYDVRDFKAAAVEYESALGHPAASARQRADARNGLESVGEFRAKRQRLRSERSRLNRILLTSAAFWVAVFCAGWYLTRTRRSHTD